MKPEERQYLDDLSGAYNRRYLSEVLGPQLKTQMERRSQFCLAMVDVDRFKEINDLFGHQRGDQVIKEFSVYLRSCIRPSDRVIRYGGDEFLCYLQGIGRQDAERIFQRILERCRFRRMAGHAITISVGIAEHPQDAQDLEALLKLADESLYDAKRRGRDRLGAIRSRHLEVPLRAFVNRSQEKERLSLYLMAAEDRAKLILVKGTVGIGKTRLVKEVLNRISYREVLWADCLPLEDPISYYCIRQLLNYKLRRRGEELIAQIPPAFQLEIVKLLPQLASAVSHQVQDIGPVLDKYRLYEGVRLFIEQGDIRKIVVVDNIQWMDRESPGVLRYLMRTLRERDIAFVLICRSEELGPEWQEFLAGAGRELDLYEVEVGHLDTAAIRECAAMALGEEPLERLNSFLIKKSGGNPYFVEEILRELHHRQYLVLEGQSWRYREPEDMEVPRKVADVVYQKYGRLSPEAKNLLAMASVAGGFDDRILEELTGYNPGHIDGLMEEIVRAGLATGERGRMRFREEISQQAIYQKWAEGGQARQAHRQVAEILERNHRLNLSLIAEPLAYHYYQARDADRGIEYCLKSAEKAEQTYSFWDARRYYSWALDLMESRPSQDQKRWWAIKMRALDIEFRIGDPQRLLSEYEAVLKRARAARNVSQTAEILFRMARTLSYSLSQHRQALPLARRSYLIFKRIGNRQQLSASLNLLGVIYRYLGQYGRSAAVLKHSVSLKVGRFQTGQAWTNLGNLAFSRGRLDEAKRYFDKALKSFQASGDRIDQALVQGNLSILYRVKGNLAKAQDLLQRSLNLKRLVGDRRGEAQSLLSLGNIYSDQDRFLQAIESYRSALKINAEVPQKGLGILALRNMGLIYREIGQYPRALECLQQSLALAEEAGDRESRQLILNGIGDVLLSMGDLAQARKRYAEAARCAVLPNIPAQFMLAASLTAYFLESGELRQARRQVKKAYRFSRTIRSKYLASLVSVLSAELWLRQGRPREALKEVAKIERLLPGNRGSYYGQANLLAGRAQTMLEHYEKAQRTLKLAKDVFHNLGIRPQEGVAAYYLGLLKSAVGQKELAQAMLEEAYAIFENLGAKAWQNRAQQELRRIEAKT